VLPPSSLAATSAAAGEHGSLARPSPAGATPARGVGWVAGTASTGSAPCGRSRPGRLQQAEEAGRLYLRRGCNGTWGAAACGREGVEIRVRREGDSVYI
jgi:hypothetical protein